MHPFVHFFIIDLLQKALKDFSEVLHKVKIIIFQKVLHHKIIFFQKVMYLLRRGVKNVLTYLNYDKNLI